MAAPIRSAEEITLIINKGNNAIADVGHDLIGDAKRGLQLDDLEFRDKVYRLILLRAYLKNITAIDGTTRLYWTSSTNEKAFNVMLEAIQQLSKSAAIGSIPLIRGRRIPLTIYPMDPGNGGSVGGGGSSTGGPATPGGVTFQNLDVSTPGEIIDTIDAASTDYAFYVIYIRGSGGGEGSRLDILGVSWRGTATPNITEYRGADIGGSTAGVTLSAALNGGNIELTLNTPTNGWSVKGNRISFENISFQNALGPLPTGGTLGQYLKKLSSTNFDVGWAAIAIGDVTGLTTALTNYLLLAGGTMSGAIAMGSNKITGLGASTVNGDAVRHEQLQAVITSLANYLLLAGGTMSGPIAMGGQKITGLGAATGAGDALRYEQLVGVYQLLNQALLLSGGTMSGPIAMGGQKITGLGAATANGEAVRYEQLINDPDTSYYESNDFISANFVADGTGEISSNGFIYVPDGTGSGYGASTYGIDATEKALGVVNINTGTTGTGKSYFFKGATSGIPFTLFQLLFGNQAFSLKFRIAPQTLASQTQDYTISFGFGAQFSVKDQTDGAYFTCERIGVSTNEWDVVTANSGVRTTTPTGVPVTTTYSVFEIRVNEAGTSVEFYIDDVLVATHSTNIPTVNIGIFGNIIKTVGISSRTLNKDWYSLLATRSTSR